MAKAWGQIKTEVKRRGRLDASVSTKAKAATEEYVQSYQLREIRKRANMTQQELADAIGVLQTRISQIERGDLSHTELATIRAYVEGLGGSIAVVAQFGDTQLQIS